MLGSSGVVRVGEVVSLSGPPLVTQCKALLLLECKTNVVKSRSTPAEAGS